MAYLLLFFAVWFNALARTFNNLRVMRLQTAWAIPVALVTSLIDVCVIASVVKLGIWVFIPIGLGFGVGQITAAHLFRRRREKCAISPNDEIE